MRQILGATPLLAALAWTAVLLVGDGPLSPTGALLAGIGMVATSTVAVVGMTVSGGRWAHRLAMAGVGLTLVLALIEPVSVLWLIGVVVSAVAASALFLPPVTAAIRKLPAAAGPPQAAVLPPVVLVSAPFFLGVSFGDGAEWAALLVGLSAPVAAYLFSRVVFGGLLVVRVVWPLLAVGLAPFLGIWGGVVSVALGAAVAVPSWRADVKASFHPPREIGSTFAIPPEMAPPEILDAAGIDDTGKKR